MNIISLDLELNQPSKSIIQVGIAVGNIETGMVLLSSSFNIKVPEVINPFIINLTGITQEDVDTGEDLQDVYKELCSIHKDYKCFRNCLTWGGGDAELLRKELSLDDESFIFGRRWIDAKTVFITRSIAKNEKISCGLKKACSRLGFEFRGTAHNARDDAVNTFIVYHKLLQELKG